MTKIIFEGNLSPIEKETKDFAMVLKNVVSSEICDFVANEFRMLERCVNLMNPDTQAGKEIGLTESFSIYSPLFTETLSLLIQPKIEEAVGKKLYPTYSYGRIYKNGAELEPHLDRRSSEYTISLCVYKEPDQDWQLVVKHLNKKCDYFSLEKGDLLIYPGRDLNHWREGKFAGKEQIQVFIQYVDANGTSQDLKWDGRPAMGMPWESARADVHQGLEQMMDTLKQVVSDEHLDAATPTLLDTLTNIKTN